MDVTPRRPVARMIWRLGQGLAWVGVGGMALAVVGMRSHLGYTSELYVLGGSPIPRALLLAIGVAAFVLGAGVMLIAAWLEER